MVGSAAGNATPTPGRWAFIAFAFDAGAVASFAFGALVGGALDTDAKAWGFVILGALVPALATLTALAASIRAVSEARKPLAKIAISALGVVSGILLLLCGAGLFFLLQGTP